MRCAIARRAVERDLARLSERFARIHFLRRGPRRKSRTRSGAACMETTQYPEGGAPVRRTARAGARRLGDGPPAPLPRRELRLTAARTVLTQFGACRCWRMAEAMQSKFKWEGSMLVASCEAEPHPPALRSLRCAGLLDDRRSHQRLHQPDRRPGDLRSRRSLQAASSIPSGAACHAFSQGVRRDRVARRYTPRRSIAPRMLAMRPGPGPRPS